MPSVALSSWDTGRAARLDQLDEAHRLLASAGGAVQAPIEAVEWSMILVMAAEFQGFARELHDECSDFLASAIARGDQRRFEMLRNSFTAKRDLDAANAKPDSVETDFRRLGVASLWSEIEKASPDGARWHSEIGILNKARNAIAHGNPAKLATLSGVTVNHTTILSWRAACNGVSKQMDGSLSSYLTSATGRQPW